MASVFVFLCFYFRRFSLLASELSFLGLPGLFLALNDTSGLAIADVSFLGRPALFLGFCTNDTSGVSITDSNFLLFTADFLAVEVTGRPLFGAPKNIDDLLARVIGPFGLAAK